MGKITKEDVRNEIEAVKAFAAAGGHRHLVEVLNYGEIRDMSFIDMALCDLNLQEYMQGESQRPPEFAAIVRRTNEPGLVFLASDSSWSLNLQNIWTIMSHIAQGVKFVHSQGKDHRDLKPENGMMFMTGNPNSNSPLFS